MAATFTASGSLTRATGTTQYASGDLIAQSGTAGSCSPITLRMGVLDGGRGKIPALRIRKSGTGITTCTIRAHFFTAAPAVTNGDNGVWLCSKFDGWLGSIDVTIDRAFSDGAAGIGYPTVPLSFVQAATALTGEVPIYVVLEARSAYTPADSEIFTVSAEVQQG